MRGDDVAPNKLINLDLGILARASLILQYVSREVLNWLEPVGCSVDDRGFKCDFRLLKDRWPREEDAKLLEVKVPAAEALGVSINEVGVTSDELLDLLEHTKVYEVNGVKAYLEPSAVPGEEPVKAIKIMNISAHNPTPDIRLVRLIGVAFASEDELKSYLEWFEEASRRDHRILGQKLDLFSFHEEVGPGLVIYHPKGQVIREELIKFIREVNERLGYKELYTPHVFRSTLWKISGHYHLYKEKMVLAKIEGEEYGIKPMNCPGHILVYKSMNRSYRDLPIKYSEFGTVYRWEKRGELYGLLRVRGFTQDDGHAFLREDQVKDEIKAIIKEIMYVLSTFGFKGEDVRIHLSTRPDEYIGTEEMWDKATNALKEALDELGIPYDIKEGEGAFYGPKIDVHFRDSLGRWWQCSTIQVDFALPKRFGLEYTDKDGSKKRPVMIHRAILGSVERFMAIIIEEFSGRLPTWISPIQVVVIPAKKAVYDYAKSILERLKKEGFRVKGDFSNDTVPKKIRKAYDEAIPYIVMVGPKEMEKGTITVRGRRNRQVWDVSLEDFIKSLKKEIAARSVTQKALDILENN